MRKSLTIGLCFLLICSMITPISLGYTVRSSIEQQPSTIGNGNTLYVGGLGPNNYTSIQSALDDASDCDTVFVYDYSSPYYENIMIKERINLIGEDKNTTIIDGGNSGTVVKLDWVSGVKINGFTIQNSGNSQGDAGIGGIFFGSLIKSNIISNNNYGIINIFITGYPGMGENDICDNIVTNNIYGIKIASSFNKVFENQIVNNNGGIKIEPSGLPTGNRLFDIFTTDNEVYRNTITDNNYYAIEISHSDKNKVFENIIKNNGDGIRIYGFEDSINNSIFKNNFISNEIGIYIDSQREGGYNNNVYQNNFIRNKRNAYFIGNGKNVWDENYWNRPRIFPYFIIGKIKPFEYFNIFIPWFNIDRNPAQEPYDIGG